MAYLQINIYFMIIIYLVELTTTDTLNALRHIHTRTQTPPFPRPAKTNTNGFCPHFEFRWRSSFSKYIMCAMYTIIKGECDNIFGAWPKISSGKIFHIY